MPKKVILAIFVISLLIGCTKDDICPEGTPTTPRLIIKFMDFSNRSLAKEVTNLRVALTNNEEEAIFQNTDSIFQIPLNPSLTSVQFTFTQDTAGEEENSDNIRFTYGIGEDVYINRACGFNTTFTALGAEVRPEGAANSNWLRDLDIINNTIENEDVTHITIFH
jgi:hypothetical protein